MLKKNGFTLIEVTVSIALLGIISLGFLGALNNNLNFLKINKDMTTSVFLDQKDMELAILQTKLDIESGTIPSGSLTTIENVFESGIDVKAYQLKFPYNKQNIYTLVTDTRLPEFKVPIAQNVKAQLRNNTTPVDYAYALPETNVLGSSSIDPSTADVFMVNNYNWYVSRPGFNIPMPNTPIPEIEIGNKYPKFPEDYSIIPSSTTINLNNVTAYAGRHIVFAVTPAAKSGKMGKTIPSNPVFISGLPPIAGTNLFLHLDASTVSNTDTSQVSSDGSDLIVQKWNDLSVNKKNAIQNTQAARPKLKEHPIGGDFVGKFVDFDASKSLAVVHNSISNVSLNVFAVVRGNDSAVFYKNGVKDIAASGEAIGGSGGQWKIVTTTYSSSNNNFILGNSDVDVAELIIYNGAFTEANKNDVIKYLKEKYIPLVTVGNIIQLRPMTDVEVIKNEPYTLPSAVLAEMEYGSDRFVPVSWDKPVNVDTTALGTYTFTATAINDNTKTATLKVIVKDRIYVSSVSLNSNNHTLQVGKSFVLYATILPVDATNKAITWISSNPTVATVSSNGFSSAEVNALSVGTAVITVKTADGNKTATCTVTVTAPTIPGDWSDSLILHLDASNTDSISIDIRGGTNYIKDWKDLSKNSNNFTQNINNKQPSLVSNGLQSKPVIHFDGSDDFLTLGSSELKSSDGNEDLFADDDNEFSIFMVSKAPGIGNNTFLSKSKGWGTSATYAFGRVDNYFKIRVRGTEVNSIASNGDFNLHTAIYSKNENYYWLNGGNDSKATVGTAIVQDMKIVLGATNSGTKDFLNGDIAEVRIYNSALTEEQRKIVENELKNKWLIKPIKEWNFDIAANGTDGWHDPRNINNFKQESDSSIGSGVISGNILNGDPYFHSPDKLNIDTNEAAKIVIRLKNNTASNTGQIYFRTSDGDSYSESRRINFTLIPNSGYTNYEIDVGSLASWTGTLNEFRIDPAVNATGTFSIDYVKIYK